MIRVRIAKLGLGGILYDFAIGASLGIFVLAIFGFFAS